MNVLIRYGWVWKWAWCSGVIIVMMCNLILICLIYGRCVLEVSIFWIICFMIVIGSVYVIGLGFFMVMIFVFLKVISFWIMG